MRKDHAERGGEMEEKRVGVQSQRFPQNQILNGCHTYEADKFKSNPVVGKNAIFGPVYVSH